MIVLLVIAFVLWGARKSAVGAGRIVADDYRREAEQYRENIEQQHPEWTPRRRNRLAAARAVGATSADLLNLGPAMGRALRRGWSDARAEWGSTREEHEAWRAARFGDLAGRRTARDGKRPSPLRRAGRRAWALLLGPVPQVAFIPAPRQPAPAQNVVPFPRQPTPAQPGPGSSGPAPAQPRLTPAPATPATPGPGSAEPGPATPAPGPGSTPAQAGPDSSDPAPASPGAAPAQDTAPAAGPAPAQEPGNPTTVPAPAETGTDTAIPAATTGGTNMANLTGETSTYEATNQALDGFSEAAAETLNAAEQTAMPITAQAAAAVAAAEQLSASLAALGMKDESLNADVSKLAGISADLRDKANEMNSIRIQVMDLAMLLDSAARSAKDNHVQGQGSIGEALAATGGTAADANAYFGR